MARSEPTKRRTAPKPLTVAGLFAGIGGIELGLHASASKAKSVLLCEIDDAAQEVLRARFPDVSIHDDVRALAKGPGLPPVDLLAAGFPCQDLSQAGQTAGIKGTQSGLVGSVFKMLDRMETPPRWLLLENVSFMLQLDGGAAMTYLTRQLAKRDYRWAYRVVDTLSLGLPQRRHRVILLASKTEDPRRVLLADDPGPPDDELNEESVACGFYWTEGLRGLGWAVDAVPTLKGGSSIGIPSPPAIVLPGGDGIVCPNIEDAERLQGFPSGWTEPAELGRRNGPRWKLVGNAVSVPVARWVGDQLANPGEWVGEGVEPVAQDRPWPTAAWGSERKAWVAHVSRFPAQVPHEPLADFLNLDTAVPLSLRATTGFRERYDRGTLRKKPYLLDALRRHAASMTRRSSAQ